jgi:large subunit ribosomal protein L15
MTITLTNLKKSTGTTKKRKRVGRGNSSGHGTYSTRGMKGQRSRSGGKSGLKKLGLKMMLQRIPKKKGFTSRNPSYIPINLSMLESLYKNSEVVTTQSLLKKGVISRKEKMYIKVLGSGKLTKNLTVKAHDFSQSASDAIMKAGGKAILITKK